MLLKVCILGFYIISKRKKKSLNPPLHSDYHVLAQYDKSDNTVCSVWSFSECLVSNQRSHSRFSSFIFNIGDQQECKPCNLNGWSSSGIDPGRAGLLSSALHLLPDLHLQNESDSVSGDMMNYYQLLTSDALLTSCTTFCSSGAVVQSFFDYN